MTRALEVLRAGLPVLVQDAGRPGLAALGVGASGAADRGSWALGNRLLANPAGTAGLEVTFGGVELMVHGTLVLALTGARTPATLDGSPAPFAAPFTARDGQRLSLGTPETGLRTYVAVRGGVVVDEVLGSRATDVLSGLGPDQLSTGSTVPVGDPPPDAFPDVDVAPVRELPDEVVLRVVPGPRDDWFADLGALAATRWTASSDSNRVGLRLDGEPLERNASHAESELPSEGVALGAVQVPANGRPVVFLADHPVTGGYPVIGVLHPTDVGRAAQARPGQPVRFVLDPGSSR